MTAGNSIAGGARRRWRWLSVLGGGLLLVAVATVLWTPPVDGFEPSIYTAYPLWFWGILLAVLFVGQALILREGLAEPRDPANWRIGFLLAFLVATILLFLPVFRGYPMYGRADPLTHIGHVNLIQQTGGAPFQNIYQNIHQLLLASSYATGLEPTAVANMVTAIISLFAIVATFAVLDAVFDRRRVLLTLPFAVVLFGGSAHLNPSPYPQSILLIPFVLYLFVRSQQTESFVFRLPLAVAVVAVILYHPLTALFLLLIFAIHYAVVLRSDAPASWRTRRPISRVTATSVVQLSAVTFLAWYYNFVGIILRFETVFRRLLDPGESETELETYGQTVSEFSPSILDIARVATFMFGQRMLLLALGSAFLLVALWRYARGKRFGTPYLLTFLLAFTAFVALGALFLFVDMIGGFGRPLMVAQLFAVLVAGSLVASLYEQVPSRTLVTVGVVALLVCLGVLTMVTLYHVPLGGNSTSQVTQQDFAGAEWYLEHDLQAAPLLEYGTSLFRFEHALVHSESRTVPGSMTYPPPHFNYTVHDTLAESYDTELYLVVTERGRQFYPHAYPGYDDDWRFQPEDFDRLAADPAVSHVYTNGEVDIYYVDADAS